MLAALAYSYGRRLAEDPRFTFGTGKLGDLAGFTSAIVLAMIALLIGYEAVSRLFTPVDIDFAEAIPIAVLGLGVNVASVWLLSGGEHGHRHGHGHGRHASHDQGHGEHDHPEEHRIATPDGIFVLSIFEDGVPPAFRLRPETGPFPGAGAVTVETVRPEGTRRVFAMGDRGGWLESEDAIPEPHAFVAHVRAAGQDHPVVFEEHDPDGHRHPVAHRDNNMRAAVVHVLADAAVSVLVIIGLVLARAFGWLWMDPLAGIVGACVIASWSWGLVRDNRAVVVDQGPGPADGRRRAPGDRGGGRPGGRPAFLAARAGAPRRDPVRCHRARARA